MKNPSYIISVGLICLAEILGPGSSAASWWEKGAGLFEKTEVQSGVQAISGPSVAEIDEAFKEALLIGSENVVNKLGSIDGFNSDPSIHIPLPEELTIVKTMLSRIGMAQMVDDLELKLNRAAESATPKAKKLFIQSIKDMTFEDVKTIYKGADDSATRYFQRKMAPALHEEMQPIVDGSLSQVGAIQAYDSIMGRYQTLPLVPDVKANLTEHVIQRGMDGIFFYMAKEEAAIRKNPVKQTTVLLKKVFGTQ